MVVLVSAAVRPVAAQAGPWRAAAGVGVLGDVTAVTLGGDYRIRGPVAAGGRVSLYSSRRTVREGEAFEGGAFEGAVALRARHGPVEVRAVGGAGIATVTINTFRAGNEVRRTTEGYPLLFGGGGVDVYPVPGLGIGVEARAVRSSAPLPLAEVGVGLRLRF